MYRTMDDLMRAAGESDSSRYWFSRATMDAWGTEIESDVIGGHWFVTSERGYRHSEDDCRVYSVRYCDEDGEVQTAPSTMVGEFADLGDALDAAHTIVRVLNAYNVTPNV